MVEGLLIANFWFSVGLFYLSYLEEKKLFLHILLFFQEAFGSISPVVKLNCNFLLSFLEFTDELFSLFYIGT
jgi:hypothetical protein